MLLELWVFRNWIGDRFVVWRGVCAPLIAALGGLAARVLLELEWELPILLNTLRLSWGNSLWFLWLCFRPQLSPLLGAEAQCELLWRQVI